MDSFLFFMIAGVMFYQYWFNLDMYRKRQMERLESRAGVSSIARQRLKTMQEKGWVWKVRLFSLFGFLVGLYAVYDEIHYLFE